MSGEQSSFLQDYLKVNEGTEIPESFALWSGIGIISAALGRRLWMDMGVYTVYPNIMTILVAASGQYRKSTAIGVGESILRNISPGPNIIAQKVTPEALIEQMSTTRRDEAEDSLSKVCEGFVLVDELANFLNKKTYEQGLAALMIPLYDCKEVYDYHTKSRGREMIENACLGMLSASTVDWIKTAIPLEAIGGGLTSRIIFVYEDKRIKAHALTKFSKEKKTLKESLIKRLEKIAELSGEVFLTKEAESLFVELYDSFFYNSNFYDDAFLGGYASRRHVHLLKIAMCLAASDVPDSTIYIKEEYIQASDMLLKGIEKNLDKVFMQIASSDKGTLEKTVYDFIKSCKKVSRSQVLEKFSYRLDAKTLEEIIATLSKSKKIKLVAQRSDLFYEIR